MLREGECRSREGANAGLERESAGLREGECSRSREGASAGLGRELVQH